jgi:5-methylcytosine-specific restriction protein A
MGLAAMADTVDHVIPHRGDRGRFFDAGNLQSLCKQCHDRKTAREDGGFGNRQGGQAAGERGGAAGAARGGGPDSSGPLRC